jgi:uncharacterized protein (TIGR00730 family)
MYYRREKAADMKKRKVITLFGSSIIRPGDEDYAKAESLGRTLARAGYAICNGGYMGSMEASAKGAKEAGGEAIGVTCEIFSRRTACPYLTEEQRQPGLLERIGRLIELGDAYIVLGGGIGTLAELFVVWNLLAIECIPPKPVLMYGNDYDRLLEDLQRTAEIGPKQMRFIKVVTSEEEILAELEK